MPKKHSIGEKIFLFLAFFMIFFRVVLFFAGVTYVPILDDVFMFFGD
jgi:hypothetical protein